MFTPRMLVVGLLATALLAHATATYGGDPCKRTTFDTKLVKDACASGGLPAAKDAMKKFVKEAKTKQAGLECSSCHAKMAPSYALKPDGLALYRRLGGQ